MSSQCLFATALDLERMLGLDLWSGQAPRIAEIRKEYRPKVQEAGNKLRAAIREEVEMIVAVLKA